MRDPASGKEYHFTCGIWRYHPPTKRLELFAEGTSNPWGLDYNRNGDWFISACVIDHRWHITQSGYWWFMPVAQWLGPDGCFYVMDWYDRYHCYQDAKRDSPRLDRLKGRVYRVAYADAPRAEHFDLGKSPLDELVHLLGHPDAWWRRTAQRVLNERFDNGLVPRLQEMALSTDDATPAPMHALWLLLSRGKSEPAFHLKVLSHPRTSKHVGSPRGGRDGKGRDDPLRATSGGGAVGRIPRRAASTRHRRGAAEGTAGRRIVRDDAAEHRERRRPAYPQHPLPELQAARHATARRCSRSSMPTPPATARWLIWNVTTPKSVMLVIAAPAG